MQMKAGDGSSSILGPLLICYGNPTGTGLRPSVSDLLSRGLLYGRAGQPRGDRGTRRGGKEDTRKGVFPGPASTHPATDAAFSLKTDDNCLSKCMQLSPHASS